MKFIHKNRRVISFCLIVGFLLAGTVTPASGEYDPRTGRWLQADPNGTGILLQPRLNYHAANPTVTVNMAYELQFGDGMNFYQFLTSNPPNNLDPNGLSVRAFVRNGAWWNHADAASEAIQSAYDTQQSLWQMDFGFDDYGEAISDILYDRDRAVGNLTTAYVKAVAGGGQSLLYALAATDWLGFWMQTMAPDVQAATAFPIAAGRSLLRAGQSFISMRGVRTKKLLEAAARRAIRKVGSGRGPVYGTRVHTAFKRQVRALGGRFKTEVTYLGGDTKPYGFKGGIRVDVVEGSVKRPIAIYDLKTGGAKLTPARIRQIRSHLPDGSKNIPIMEIRGDR